MMARPAPEATRWNTTVLFAAAAGRGKLFLVAG